MPADHRRPDGGCDVVVAWREIGHERAQSIEMRLVAHFFLFFDLHLYLIQWDMAWPLDHYLNVIFPSSLGQLAKRLQFGELGRVTGIGKRSRTQPVTQGETHVVLLEDFADVFEIFVEQILT